MFFRISINEFVLSLDASALFIDLPSLVLCSDRQLSVCGSIGISAEVDHPPNWLTIANYFDSCFSLSPLPPSPLVNWVHCWFVFPLVIERLENNKIYTIYAIHYAVHRSIVNHTSYFVMYLQFYCIQSPLF